MSSLSAASDQGLTGAYCIKSGTAFEFELGGDHLHDLRSGVNGQNCGPLQQHRGNVTRVELGLRRAELAV